MASGTCVVVAALCWKEKEEWMVEAPHKSLTYVEMCGMATEINFSTSAYPMSCTFLRDCRYCMKESVVLVTTIPKEPDTVKQQK